MIIRKISSLLLLATSLLGCSINRAGGALLASLFTDVRYSPDGFEIIGPEKNFKYSQKHNREILWVKDKRMNQLKFVDQGCDQKVDQIYLVLSKTRYLRGDDKSKELFQKADKIFSQYRQELGVDEIKKHWKNSPPHYIVGNNGLDNI